MVKIYTAEDAHAVDELGTVKLTILTSEDGMDISRSTIMVSSEVLPIENVMSFANQWVADNPTEVSPFTPPTLDELKARAKQQVVQFANQVTSSILSKYPEAEQKLWPDFRREALAFDQSVPATNTLSDFPVLNQMLTSKLGPTVDDTETLARLVAAVPGILTNADAWSAIAEYVAGLRGRVFDQLDGATDQAGIDAILASAKTEAETVAAQYGL